MHSYDAVLRKATSLHVVYVKSVDASAKSFTLPVYSVSRKVSKSVSIMKETVEK
jgi:hypothetical protein